MPEKQDPFVGMTSQERIVQRVQDTFKMANDGLTKQDFAAAFKKMSDTIASAFVQMNKRLDARLAQIKDGKDGRDGKDGKSIRGEKGERGERGPIGKTFIALRGERGIDGKDGSPDTPEDIVIKLESLEDEERLDASAIKNLPAAIQQHNTHFVPSHGPLWGLQDVDVSGISVGQSIKWDGIRWIPFTPSGGNSAAYNEVAGGSGTTWTAANAPILGTLRVYANGQRLIETTDYSLSGTDITTLLSWDTGTVLLDYEY